MEYMSDGELIEGIDWSISVPKIIQFCQSYCKNKMVQFLPHPVLLNVVT